MVRGLGFHFYFGSSVLGVKTFALRLLSSGCLPSGFAFPRAMPADVGLQTAEQVQCEECKEKARDLELYKRQLHKAQEKVAELDAVPGTGPGSGTSSAAPRRNNAIPPSGVQRGET